MKKQIYCLALALIFISYQTTLNAQANNVNTEASSIVWTGAKIGGKHTGTIQLKSGKLNIQDDKIIDGNFIIDMSTIMCSDLKDPGYNQQLVGHLKSDDFFGVNKYPEAKLIITKSTAFKNNTAKLTGNLSIKNKTQKITFDITRKGDSYIARIDVDRSKFDVRYGSDSFFDNLGDKVIYDIFNLDVTIKVSSVK